MEILAPAGSLEKLHYALLYGADAAYMGLQGFSLRANASNAGSPDFDKLHALKSSYQGKKKLYGAVNIFAHDHDLERLDQYLGSSMDSGIDFPFDAWIVSDLGTFSIIRKHLPQAEMHLSTQANCLNSEAAKFYRDIGFSRIIPGREMSLFDIGLLKSRVPDIEVEVFVHGAMCMAYSGRCFLSSTLNKRSANKGDCSHTCRWSFQALAPALAMGQVVVEEESRPGEYFPILEEEGHMAIFSSKDLNMVGHLQSLRDAGVDSVKIEGRMKSAYYVAMVTRAYRKAHDALTQESPAYDPQDFIVELERVSHREYSTGFYFDDKTPSDVGKGSYQSTHTFVGCLLPCEGDTVPEFSKEVQHLHHYKLDLVNTLHLGAALEAVGPDVPSWDLGGFSLSDEFGKPCSKATHQKTFYLHTSLDLPESALLRIPAKASS